MARSQSHSPASFSGFAPAALNFLGELEQNNEREWFEARKSFYEDEVKGPMLQLMAGLNQTALRVGPEYVTEPKKAVYRIYRDVRFSKNKAPYKTNIAGGLHRQNLPKGESAGFYLHLDARELFVAGGLWMPEPEILKLMRAHIGENQEEFRAILAHKKLKKLFGEMEAHQLSRPPKGVPPDHPAADLLRQKMFVFSASLPPETAMGPKLLDEAGARLEAIFPFLEFLNRPLAGRAKRQRDERAYTL